jgi:hypothetical protein
LYSLSLDPFDAYTYGKTYSILLLARQHEPHILAHFEEFVETHFLKLTLKCPEGAVDLVREYVKSVSSSKATHEPLAPNNKFREWLEAKNPI